MSERLNQTSRHIAYLCSWPYYMLLGRQKPPWEEIRRRCNMWRVADDVAESLASILNIINTYATLQVRVGFGFLKKDQARLCLDGANRDSGPEPRETFLFMRPFWVAAPIGDEVL